MAAHTLDFRTASLALAAGSPPQARAFSVMKSWRVLFGLFLAFATASLRCAGAEEKPLARGPEIVAGENDAEWRALFTALAGKGAVFSTFTERRWFPVRTEPVVLKGEMRLSPEHGMSLRYLENGGRVMIVDKKGILLRDDRGRSRAAPADARVPAANTALLPVLRFDFPELVKNFVVYGARDGAAWRLDFVPRDAALARTLGDITVRGENEDVRGLELRRAANQRIEISIDETQTGVTFSAADLKKFFR
jgi:hypothetical protein